MSATNSYRTPKGRVSMDPTKWNVMRFSSEEVAHNRDVVSVFAWAIYPPEHTVPMLMYGTHGQAIRSAQRYAMFAVVPPEMVPEVLRDNTIGEEQQ